MSKKIKLLIVGQYSFIGTNLYNFLKKKIFVKKISYESFKKLSVKYLNSFTYICNCSITKNYRDNKYKNKNDLDLQIAKKIENLDCKFIFLSTRKIYSPKANLLETSNLNPISNYAKNKLISEQKIKKIIKDKSLILRVSNIIGKNLNVKNNRKVSNTFIDNYFKFQFQMNENIYYENNFKDFLSIIQFKDIFYKILKQNLVGTYNLSLGRKVYISEILRALNKNINPTKFKIKNEKNNDNFYLNNKKLLKKIKLKITKKDLLNYCSKI
jgi:nucleoside-diphosphate-sugar epimerase